MFQALNVLHRQWRRREADKRHISALKASFDNPGVLGRRPLSEPAKAQAKPADVA